MKVKGRCYAVVYDKERFVRVESGNFPSLQAAKSWARMNYREVRVRVWQSRADFLAENPPAADWVQ